MGCILNTGASVNEIIGLNRNEINLNQFTPYIIIRSNNLRIINNIIQEKNNSFGRCFTRFNE